MCSRASSWRLLGVVYRQPLLLELAHHRPGHRLLRRLVPPLPSACSSGAQGAAPRGDRPCVHRRHPQHRAGVEPAVASTSDERGLRAALPREHVRRVRVGLDGSRRDRHRRQRGRSRMEEYELPCKPGDPLRRRCLVTPYHDRLDWQMWFAAMSTYEEEESWFRLRAGCSRETRRRSPCSPRSPFPNARRVSCARCSIATRSRGAASPDGGSARSSASG